MSRLYKGHNNNFNLVVSIAKDEEEAIIAAKKHKRDKQIKKKEEKLQERNKVTLPKFSWDR